MWGGILGLQESTLRAAVGDLVKTRRATACGIFNAFYGLALLAGGSLLGFIYERSVLLLVAYVVAAQLIAMIAFAPLRRVRATDDAGAR